MTKLITSFTPLSTQNNFTGFVGGKFTYSGASGNVAYELGNWMNSGNTGPRTLYLLRGDDVLLGSAVLDLTGRIPGQFYYANMAPVVLTNGFQYRLVQGVTSGGEQYGVSSSACSMTQTGATDPVATFSTTLSGFTDLPSGNQEYSGIDMVFSATIVNQGMLFSH